MSSLSLARQVKNKLSEQFGKEPWFAGIGATREDGIGFVVKISVHPGVPRPEGAVPSTLDGITIQIIEASS
ncbi:MAG TPA: hypothetical protein VGL13_14965 [Polyangiaceae bacterium]|jgi:hypothetical protein